MGKTPVPTAEPTPTCFNCNALLEETDEEGVHHCQNDDCPVVGITSDLPPGLLAQLIEQATETESEN